MSLNDLWSDDCTYANIPFILFSICVFCELLINLTVGNFKHFFIECVLIIAETYQRSTYARLKWSTYTKYKR